MALNNPFLHIFAWLSQSSIHSNITLFTNISVSHNKSTATHKSVSLSNTTLLLYKSLNTASVGCSTKSLNLNVFECNPHVVTLFDVWAKHAQGAGASWLLTCQKKQVFFRRCKANNIPFPVVFKFWFKQTAKEPSSFFCVAK